jgi:hypothetical protein
MGVSSGNIAADRFGSRGPHECPEPPAPSAGEITPPFGAVSRFKSRRFKHLVVAAITEVVVRRALPFDERI